MSYAKRMLEAREDEYGTRQLAWEKKAIKNGWMCQLDGEPLEPEEVGQKYCNRHIARLEKLARE